MNLSKISYWLFIGYFIAAFIVPSVSFDIFRSEMLLLSVFFGIPYFVSKTENFRSLNIWFMSFLVVLTLQGLASAGFSVFANYTIYKTTEIAIMVFLILVWSKIDYKVGIIVLFIIALSQLLYNYVFTLGWAAEYGDYYSWGTVRHRIRYSTCLFAGFPLCFMLLKQKEILSTSLAFIIITILTGSIIHCESQAILGITFLMFFALVVAYARRMRLIIVVSFLLAAAIGGYFVGYDKFLPDVGRLKYWNTLISAMPGHWFLGYGAGAWQLKCGTLGLPNLGHPHNDLLLMIFEHGVLVAGLAIVVIDWIILRARKSIFLVLPYCLLLLSFCANSMITYIDMRIVFIIWTGIITGVGNEAVNRNRVNLWAHSGHKSV